MQLLSEKNLQKYMILASFSFSLLSNDNDDDNLDDDVYDNENDGFVER